ncbi:MAG: Rieske 2Fe-2S domain-containing protein [Burkholderiaceae bacterium]
MTLENKSLSLKEKFALLTQTSKGTEMGRLLRRFWHPVALSKDLENGKTLPLRVLSEDLTLYRGEGGSVHLVDGFCKHRRTHLHTGSVEGETIRCIYHGWRYAANGQCVERPAENELEVPAICKIAGYPTFEYCGLFFAYMGEGKAPDFELPRKDPYERKKAQIVVLKETWNTNWFQIAENQQDGVHISFLHRALRDGPFSAAVTSVVPRLEHDETESGIEQRATRAKNNVRIGNWTFPNNSHVVVPGLIPSDPWMDNGLWAVPHDDVSTMRFTIYVLRETTDEGAIRRFHDYFNEFGNPIYQCETYRDELMLQRKGPDERDFLAGLITAQDFIGIAGQGPIADRENEMLGQSDKGIMLLRRIFLRELDALRNGHPNKIWRKRVSLSQLPTQPGQATYVE